MLNKIIQGDCLESIKMLEDNSVDAVVCDPPYGLSFMGKKWDYDVPSVEIWKECLRVLKPGGYLLAFAGTRTQHRMAVRIEDAGFEIRDMIAWVYGSGFPKSLNIGKAIDKLQGNEREYLGLHPQSGTAGKTHTRDGGAFKDNIHITKGTSEWEGWGTALKPALEPITVARKPLAEKTVAENVLKWGTGGINIDGSRVGTEERGNPQYEGGDLMAISKGGIQKWEGKKETVSSRFPANFIHDGSNEVVDLFPDTGKGNNKGSYNYSGKEYDNKDTSMFNGDKPQAPSNFNDNGSASRFFYCAKASKSERNKGLEDFEEVEVRGGGGRVEDGYDLTDPEQVNLRRAATAYGAVKAKKANIHPTVKPIALMEYLIKLVSRENALILDPFTGSGSTGIACKNLNRKFIGCELDPEYCKIASARTGFDIEISQEEQDEIQENTDTLEEKLEALGVPGICDCGGKIVKLKTGNVCQDCLKDI